MDGEELENSISVSVRTSETKVERLFRVEEKKVISFSSMQTIEYRLIVESREDPCNAKASNAIDRRIA